MIIGNTKGFIRGKALSVEGHTHTGYAASSHTHTTSQVTGLDSEISSLKSSVSNGKSLIASAITDKGVSTASDATFQTMANNIGNISTSTKFLPYKIPLYVTHSNPIVNKPFSVTNRYNFSLDWGNAFTKQAFDALQIVDPNNVYVSTYQSDSYYPYSGGQYGGYICATGRIQ